jgi:hypothetical protein
MQTRLGIGPDFWHDMKAPHWPDFDTLIKMDWDELTEDQQRRHWFEPSYHPSLLPLLRHKFPGIEIIDRSYSQALQDIFILTFLNGKTNGTYLEIGCFHPTKINNTRLLEDFGWSGVSIDQSKAVAPLWAQIRPNSTFILADAFDIDYNKLVGQYNLPDQIDFLQTDVDSQEMDVELLERVLLTGRKFSVIMFEHNLFLGSTNEKTASATLLEKYGYQKIVDNLACKSFGQDKFVAFEDWWIDPSVVDQNLIKKFITLGKDQIHPLELLCEPGSIDWLMEPVWKQKDIWKSTIKKFC